MPGSWPPDPNCLSSTSPGAVTAALLAAGLTLLLALLEAALTALSRTRRDGPGGMFTAPLARAVAHPVRTRRAAAIVRLLLVAGLVLLAPPVTLLGTASPFAVRLALEDKESSGKTAGRIYALSTLGSFIGTFLPVLVLIPAIGTYKTFIVLSLMLMTPAWVGLAKAEGIRFAARYIWMPAILIIASLLGLSGFDKIAENIVFEGESAYNYIQVQETNGYRILRLNEGQGIHSIYHPEIRNYHGPWEQVLAAPFFYPPSENPMEVSRIAILGLAAGTSAQQAMEIFPEAMIDGFEIDPEIVEVGNEYFAMGGEDLTIHVKDARAGLSQSEHLYDIISVDAYRPPYIPWHLTTLEFFEEIRSHLSQKGTLVINVARIYNDRRLVDALYQTIGSVFEDVYVVDLPDSLNTMIFATKTSSDFNNLIQNYIVIQDSEEPDTLLLNTLEVAILNQQTNPVEGIVLTDDLAPVEWITNSMVFNLIFSENMKALQ